jgi:hypothetical protein
MPVVAGITQDRYGKLSVSATETSLSIPRWPNACKPAHQQAQRTICSQKKQAYVQGVGAQLTKTTNIQQEAAFEPKTTSSMAFLN